MTLLAPYLSSPQAEFGLGTRGTSCYGCSLLLDEPEESGNKEEMLMQTSFYQSNQKLLRSVQKHDVSQAPRWSIKEA